MDTDVLNEDEIQSSTDIFKKYKLLIKKINLQLRRIDAFQRKLNTDPYSETLDSNNNINKRKRAKIEDDNDDDYISPINGNEHIPRTIVQSKKESINSLDVDNPKLQSTNGINPDSKPLNSKTIRVLDLCSHILNDICKHEFSYPFLKPVDPISLNVPDYFDVIKEPMDLSTVKERLESDFYESIDGFIYDMRLIWDNAMKYNRPDSSIYEMAQSLSNEFEEKVKMAIILSEKPYHELKQEMLNRIKELKSSISEYEQKKQEIRSQMPKDYIPIFDVNNLDPRSRNNKPVPYEEKVQIANQVNNMESKYYPGIISIIEQDMPNVLNTDKEELVLDIDELEPSILWRISDFIKTYIFEANIIVDIDNSSVETIEQANNFETMELDEEYSSSDTDSESSDSDSDSEEDYELNRDFVPFNANIEKVEIQNADSWSQLNSEEEEVKIDTDLDVEIDIGGVAKDDNIDPLWQEFKNRGMQNQLRAQQEEKLKLERELNERKEIERIKIEEEMRLQREKELEEERKKKREEEIKRKREEERRKREQSTAEIDMLSYHVLMKTFESNINS